MESASYIGRGCRCASINPGVTVAPFRSTTLVPGPARLRISADFPIAMNLPCKTAKASALGCCLSIVMTLALMTISSGDCAIAKAPQKKMTQNARKIRMRHLSALWNGAALKCDRDLQFEFEF